MSFPKLDKSQCCSLGQDSLCFIYSPLLQQHCPNACRTTITVSHLPAEVSPLDLNGKSGISTLPVPQTLAPQFEGSNVFSCGLTQQRIEQCSPIWAAAVSVCWEPSWRSRMSRHCRHALSASSSLPAALNTPPRFSQVVATSRLLSPSTLCLQH